MECSVARIGRSNSIPAGASSIERWHAFFDGPPLPSKGLLAMVLEQHSCPQFQLLTRSRCHGSDVSLR